MSKKPTTYDRLIDAAIGSITQHMLAQWTYADIQEPDSIEDVLKMVNAEGWTIDLDHDYDTWWTRHEGVYFDDDELARIAAGVRQDLEVGYQLKI